MNCECCDCDKKTEEVEAFKRMELEGYESFIEFMNEVEGTKNALENLTGRIHSWEYDPKKDLFKHRGDDYCIEVKKKIFTHNGKPSWRAWYTPADRDVKSFDLDNIIVSGKDIRSALDKLVSKIPTHLETIESKLNREKNLAYNLKSTLLED